MKKNNDTISSFLPFATTALFASGVFRFDKMFSRRNTLQIMVKAKDELGGKLTDNGGIRKVLDEKEKQKLSRDFPLLFQQHNHCEGH